MNPLKAFFFSFTFLLQFNISGQGFHKDIFIDGGVGLSYFDLPAVSSLNLEYEFINTENQLIQNELIVGNENDENGVLLYPDGKPRFKLIYTNGGSSVTHGQSLNSEGRNRIREFYNNGGSFSGSCAGSALFSSGRDGFQQYSYYSIWPGMIQRVTICPFSANQTLPDTSSLLNYRDFGGDLAIDSLAFCYSNYARDDNNYPAGTEVLMLYNTPDYPMHEKPSSWAWKVSDTTGRGVVVGCHPEGFDSGERLELTEAIFLYALDGIGIPVVKAELTNGITRVMDKNTSDNLPAYTKIGDQQFHHFVIRLDSSSDLDISLDGEEDYNFNLYLKSGEPATPDNFDQCDTNPGSGKNLSISDAEPGLWYIAVECNESVTSEYTAAYYKYIENTEVLNGLQYNITATFSPITKVEFSESQNQNPLLFCNYPNPFNPETKIRFSLPEDGYVTLKIYNALGESVKSLQKGFLRKGEYEYTFSPGTTSSAIYFAELTTENHRSGIKLVYVK